MKTKTVIVLLSAAFPLLSAQGQAQPLRHPVAMLSAQECGLVYLCIPYHPKSAWRWVLRPGAGIPEPSRKIEVKSLDAPSLMAYVERIPAGKSIELMWQFKPSGLAHQPGLTGLKRLCTSRKIGLRVFCLEPE